MCRVHRVWLGVSRTPPVGVLLKIFSHSLSFLIESVFRGNLFSPTPSTRPDPIRPRPDHKFTRFERSMRGRRSRENRERRTSIWNTRTAGMKITDRRRSPESKILSNGKSHALTHSHAMMSSLQLEQIIILSLPLPILSSPPPSLLPTLFVCLSFPLVSLCFLPLRLVPSLVY